ncbi:InlB B-repeat-containing protein [Treponema pedis]|uniref:InlB B-repeat-containing protein n=1 Tax=Treponema pedis TaxID=409322 RepID=UPI00197DE915|nr:hypothetical protein [Treponema pedis]QSI03456.1 hypothetical protein DYQ05_00240 [Treponema pedis]
MPSAGETRQIVYFSQPEGAGLSDYSLNQIDGNTLKLNLKSGFLKKHEWGKEISPTITLYSTDGRKFNKTYDFTLRANTPPPSPKAVLAKSKDGKYVICIEVPDMNKNTGSGLLHKDLSKIFIDDSYYDFSVNDTQNGFNKPEDHSFINASDTVKLEGGGELPTSNWVLYYKTSVQVGGEKISYKIYLKDSKGLTSSEITVGTPLNKASPVKLKYGGKEILENNESTPFEIGTSSGETITLIATSDTPGAKIKGTKKLNGGEETLIGNSSSLDITLQREGSEEPTYKLVLYATADSFADSEVRTYYIKLTDTVTINGSEGNAWKTLKEEAEKPSGPSTIIIHGTIKATSAPGDNGEISISRDLTIKAQSGTAVLHANDLSRIFNVDSGKKLTLENLTLQNGKAGPGASGGGIFVNSGATLAMTNVTITNCEASHSGGGIYCQGKVTLTGVSKITVCKAPNQNGGGVYVANGGEFTMGGDNAFDNVLIQNCSAKEGGGGVYVFGNGKFAMKQNSSVSGCSITGGTPKGRGVCLIKAGTTSPSFTMSGSAKVDQNNDVYLTENSKITVNDNLTENPAAQITPQYYTDGRQVLDGSTVGLEYDKFKVTPEGSTQWFVDSSGNLTKKNHTVTFSVEGGQGGSLKGTYNGSEKIASGSSMETLTVSNGASVNFTAMPSVGYEVESWTVSPSGSISGGNPGETTASLNNITENKTVKVKFKKKTYVVTFKVDGGQGTLQGTYNGSEKIASGGAGQNFTVQHGGSVTFTATPDPDWEVENWSGVTATPANSTTATLSNIQENKTVTVKFKKKTYTVTFSVEGGAGGTLQAGSNAPTTSGSIEVTHGGSVTFTATPDPDWEVENWSGVTATPANSTTATLSNIQENKTVTVRFTNELEIAGGSGAWQKLKTEAEKPNGASILLISGNITATGGADSGQITVGRNLTVKPKSGTVTLDAAQKSGIFKIPNGKTLTLKDGVTLKNGKAGSGGGVHVEAGGTFNMQGGTITACTATEGKGVHVASGSTFKMSGSAKVDQNNDVYLTDGTKIEVTGTLTHKPAAKITPAGYTDGRVLATGIEAKKENFTVTPESGNKYWRYKKVGNDIKFVKGKLTVTFDKIISIEEHDGTTDAEYYWTLKVDNREVHVLTHHNSWKPKKPGATYNINKSGEAIVFDSDRMVPIYFLIMEEDHSSDDDIVADTTKTIFYDYDRDCLKFESQEIHLNETKDFVYEVRSENGDVDVYYSIKWEDNQ